MTPKITRRDLLNGIALGAGGVVLNAYGATSSTELNALAVLSPEGGKAYYPPVMTGMRGSHDGSYEVAHALAWQGQKPAQYEQLDEHYDVVIVGSGMSGLAAAWYYLKANDGNARILLLDNHDDFGGHAKRNEFHHNGRMLLGLAGAQNLDNPSNYSDAAKAMMNDIGIDQAAIDQMGKNTPPDYLLGGQLHADVGLSLRGVDGHQTFGGHWVKFMHGRGDYAGAVRQLPIPVVEQNKLIDFFGGERDYLDELSLTEKWDYVNSVSYNQFLLDRVALDRATIPLIDVHLLNLNGPSGWQHSVLEAILAGAPGLRAMGWISNMVDSIGAWYMDNSSEIRMFPDGNASIARLIVQKLVPAVAPEVTGYENVAVARFDYSKLDQAGQPTRIRLNSTAVGVKEVGDEVLIDYVQKGRALRVTADHCILACYNGLIPHLCPEMSAAQKEGLGYGVKVPFVYANVLLDNGQAFSKLGVGFTQCPHDPFQWVTSAPTVTNGGYEPPRDAEDPMLVFMMASPTPAADENGSARDLFRVGRHKIYSTTFAQHEQEIRDQLQSMLGQFGFDHEQDIKAITVNRIPHGYAYWYQSLYDPEWEDGQAPHEIGRAQFGRISIANSDSEARPYMDAAFDAAWRAVQEQM